MLRLHDLVRAQRRIQQFLPVTPLVHSPPLSELCSAQIWLKLEFCHPTGSFKVRGAMHKIMALNQTERSAGIVTASAGNHGLGVAHAAQALSLDNVTIFVPDTAPQAKVDKLRKFPVTLKLVGQSYEAAQQAAKEEVGRSGATYISAYDDPQVIAGAGTCGLEIMTRLPDVESVIVPVGGGGLVAGTAVAVKGISPECRIYGVQPAASPAAKLSFEQNLPIDPYEHDPTIADGLGGGFGAVPFYIARTLIEEILLYSEAELRQAVFNLVAQHQMLVEASGAISICPLLAEPRRFAGQTVVCILTGCNIDTPLLADILSHH